MAKSRGLAIDFSNFFGVVLSVLAVFGLRARPFIFWRVSCCSCFLIMASIDLGIRADLNGNEESASNQSSDTFLLCDDDSLCDNGNNDNTSNINTYADILNREHATLTEVTPGSNTDDEEKYLGHGRTLTKFESSHFDRDNVTPGRPCTAYFSSEHFVDSKAVLINLPNWTSRGNLSFVYSDAPLEIW